MKFLKIFLIIFTVITAQAHAQKKITPEEAKSHVGEKVEVRGNVSSIEFQKNIKNSPTIIRVGGKYPNQLLSIIINSDVRKKLGYNHQEEKYRQGVVIATGKIELFKGKPQIVINDPRQLGFIYDEEVPASEVPPLEKNNR